MECVALEIVGDMRPAPAPPEVPLLHPSHFIIIFIIIIKPSPSTSFRHYHYHHETPFYLENISSYHQVRVLPRPYISSPSMLRNGLLQVTIVLLLVINSIPAAAGIAVTNCHFHSEEIFLAIPGWPWPPSHFHLRASARVLIA